MKNYTVFHCHSSLSLLDSTTDFRNYIDKAKQLQMKSIGISEHGNIFQHIAKRQYCQYNGLKYLHGCEVYLTENLLEKTRDNYHTILIAKNFEGYLELNRLVTYSTDEVHSYYKPRISFDEFLNISNNIISISACMASPLNKLPLENPYYNLLCNKYDYYEIQGHNNEEQKLYNIHLLFLSEKYGKPLIFGTDTHEISEYKEECRMVLKGAKDMLYDNEDEFDLSFKTYDELLEMCRVQNCFDLEVYLDAIENTNIMANCIEDYELDKSFKYPKMYKDEEKSFKDFVNKKYKEKLSIIPKEELSNYKTRLHEEYNIFKKQGMLSYMIFMGEFSEWCDINNIPRGFARGSISGSLTAYMINIIDLNPLVWNTNLARFVNEERISLADIDIDFAPEDRDVVYKYIEERFGKFKTSRILTNGTISESGTIQEIGRALKKTIPEVNIIKRDYENNPELAIKENSEFFKHFNGLMDTTIRVGFHPCGIIASPISLDDNVGLWWNSKEKIWISQCDMKEVDSLNYVKFDILGLANIGIIKDTCKMLGIPYPKSHEINWNDQEVYKEMMLSGVGIFQMESDFAWNSLKSIQPKTIDDISMVNALIRPACESIRGKAFKRELNKNPSEFIDEMFKGSLGYMIYQEQIIEFLQKVCGFTGGQADGIRRAVGKKDLKKLYDLLPTITEGYCKLSNKPKDIAEKEVTQYMKVIEDAGGYGFSYNHSTAYSMIGYLCAYFRNKYPKEFIVAYLNNMESEEDNVSATQLAKLKNIEILNPKFGIFNAKYTIFGDKIYKGLKSLKYVSEDVMKDMSILAGNEYKNFVDLYLDIKENCSINSKQIDALISIDYFIEYGKDKKIIEFLRYFDLFYKKKQIKKNKIEDIVKDSLVNFRETENLYKDFDYVELLHNIWNKLKDEDLEIMDKIKMQLEYSGYVSVEIPKEKKLGLTTMVSGDSKKWIKVRSLRTGKEVFMSCYGKKPPLDKYIELEETGTQQNHYAKRTDLILIKWKLI